MKKVFSSTLVFFLLYCTSYSQKISPGDFKFLNKAEDSLKLFAKQILEGINAEDRLAADSNFTRMFVRALRTTNSFYYAFDSLVTISRLTPRDSSFKIFTWHLNINDNVNRQHGAIQFNTQNGSLKLLPLIDKSEVIYGLADTTASNYDWVGALYYKIIEKQASGKKIYTLLGYDENNIRSNKKIIEVLTFNEDKPLFGGAYFSFNVREKSVGRFILEYKKNAGPRLTYDEDLDMIVYEHLVSETGEPQKKYTYIPDGDYEGLQWKNGKWVHTQNVFIPQENDGKAPIPNPIRDEKGKIDEDKLMNN